MLSILYAADGNFTEIVELSQKASFLRGYETIVFDLGGLGFGNLWTPEPTSLSEIFQAKVQCMEEALKMQSGSVCWIDADSILVSGIDDLENGMFDIAIPMLVHKGKLSSAFVYIRNTKAAVRFIKNWALRMERVAKTGDMNVLRKYFEEYQLGGVELIDTIVEVDCTKIKILSSSLYMHGVTSLPGDTFHEPAKDPYHIPKGVKLAHMSVGVLRRGFLKNVAKLTLMEACYENLVRSGS